eukprot:2731397-Alexandrium_andersonii.AAC.1
MSASLVGSEMCIRDRKAFACFARHLLTTSLKGPGSGEGRVFGGPQVPVSYTHLTLPTICSV